MPNTKFVVDFDLDKAVKDYKAFTKFIESENKRVSKVSVGGESVPGGSSGSSSPVQKVPDTKPTDAFALSVKKLTAETMLFDGQSQQAAMSLSKFILAEGLTQQQIEKTISSLMAENKSLALNSEQYKRNDAAIKNLQNGYAMIQGGQQNLVGNSNSARMAMMGFNYALQDSGMFFVDWRIGMMSISNNIPMFAMGLKGLQEEAKKSEVSFMSLVKNAFTGPNAFLGIISAANFAMIAIPQILKSINAEADKAAEEGMKKFNRELKTMTDDEKLASLETIRKKLKEINDEQDKALRNAKPSQGYVYIPNKKNLSDNEEKQLEILTDEEKKIKDERTKRVPLLKNEIKDYDNKINNVKKDEADADKKILDLKDKQAAKQKELNDLLMTSEEREEKKKNALEKQTAETEKQRKELAQRLVASIKLGESVDLSDAFGKLANKPEFLDELFKYARLSWSDQIKELNEIISGTNKKEVIASATGIINELKKLQKNAAEEVAKLRIDNIENEFEREEAKINEAYSNDLDKANETIKDKDKLDAWLIERNEKRRIDLDRNDRKRWADRVHEVPEGKRPDDLAGVDDPTDEFNYRFGIIMNLAASTADVMREEFSGVWDSFFGEANSVFEKVMKRWSEMLLDETLRAGFNALFKGGVPASQYDDNILGFNILSLFGLLSGSGPAVMAGHAEGAISFKEHLAKVSEGNRPEAWIPLDKPQGIQALQAIMLAGAMGNGGISTFGTGTDMSRVAAEVEKSVLAIESWGKNVNFKYAYDEFKAGIDKDEYRRSFEV